MTTKTLFTGRTHVTSGPQGAAHSSDGFLDIRMPEPHPAAEQLFGAAWSACFMGAIQLAAGQNKITLPALPEVDAQIDLNFGDGGFFLSPRLDVSIPGLERDVAEALVEAAHGICPYSKAIRGNVEVVTKIV